ncbi:MAG: AI-2E family transporter [Candidatus Aminicenantes bacterium]|nr:AI-2E family transporter [Candidatus Aminicenantes bacterium]
MAGRAEGGLLFLKVFFAFLTTIFLIFVLKELRQIFIPFFIALFFFFMLNGTVHKLLALHIPKTLVMFGVLLVIFSTLSLFGLLIFNGASSFVDNFPAYSEKIVRLIKGTLASLKLPIIDVEQYLANIDWEKTFDPRQITAIVSGTMGNFTNFIGNLLLVLLLLMFMLGEKVPMVSRIARALSRERGDELLRIMAAIDARVQHYLFIKTMTSFITAALAALILLVGGVDFVIFSALLTFFLNFIPTFGSLVATLFPVMFAFLKYGFCLRLLVITAGLMIMNFVMGNVFEPQVMGKSLALSPIILLLSLIFWGWLWGVVGMCLAVPITAALKIVCESIPELKPLAAAMSGE